MTLGIKENQIIVGTAKGNQIGALPSKVIIVANKGSVEDLGLNFSWVSDPIIIDEGDVTTPSKMVKSIEAKARELPEDQGRRLKDLLDSLIVSSNQYFYNDGRDNHVISMWISKNSKLDLGKFVA